MDRFDNSEDSNDNDYQEWLECVDDTTAIDIGGDDFVSEIKEALYNDGAFPVDAATILDEIFTDQYNESLTSDNFYL